MQLWPRNPPQAAISTNRSSPTNPPKQSRRDKKQHGIITCTYSHITCQFLPRPDIHPFLPSPSFAPPSIYIDPLLLPSSTMETIHHLAGLYHSFSHLHHTWGDAHEEMTLTSSFERATETADFLRAKLPQHLQRPRVAIVCGSGLGGLADTVNAEGREMWEYKDVPNFPLSTGEYLSRVNCSWDCLMEKTWREWFIWSNYHRSSLQFPAMQASWSSAPWASNNKYPLYYW